MQNSSNHSSDSDDWTLITPPHSSSSSPDREEPLNLIELNRIVHQEPSVRVEDDNLTEVDLNGMPPKLTNQGIDDGSARSSSAEPSDGGFQPLDTTSDKEKEFADKDSRRPSLTQSELGEYVDLSGKDLKESDETVLDATASVEEGLDALEDDSLATDDDQAGHIQQIGPNSQTQEDAGYLTSIKAMFDDLNEAVQGGNRRIFLRYDQLIDWTVVNSSRALKNDAFKSTRFLLVILILSTVCALISINKLERPSERSINNMPSVSNCDLKSKFSFGDSIPTSHQYVELKLLHSELSQCIKRQSPTSFKYYMSEDRFKDYDQSPNKPYGSSMNQKPYRGLVCYGQEYQWRERFDRLKTDYDLDLRKLMQEAKKTITNEMLEFHHPTLQFKLILNQIEYLDFLENKRNKKQSEETIKYLKAENLQLLRRLNQPNDTGYQKVVVNLELQNAKLERENEALKANLIGKAGPTYIRQSQELEQLERENLVLKQFHHQVAQEVSKSLKQFNLHIIDASTILDDHESLKTQLMLTRGYLRRLSEKISTVLIENESLKEELKEAYLFGAVNKANLPATHRGNNDGENSNNSNALTADSCMRDLIGMKEKSFKLEEELSRLKRNCNRNVELEKSSERHLNKTGGDNGFLSNDGFSKRGWKQLGSSETAIDKNLRDTMMSQDDSSVMDDLIVYLTNFLDHQVESWSNNNGLATVEQQDASLSTDGPNAASESSQSLDYTKIIPKYIREAVRPLMKKDKSPIPEAISYILDLLPAPLNMQINTDSNGDSALLKPSPAPVASEQSNEDAPGVQSAQAPRETEVEGVLAEPHNASSVDEPVQSARSKADSLRMNASPGWLFKRAKQRKELRRGQGEPKSNWMLMRATLRETLREAASNIVTHYIDGVRETMGAKQQRKASSSSAHKEDTKQRCAGKAGKREKKGANNKRTHYKHVYHNQEL